MLETLPQRSRITKRHNQKRLIDENDLPVIVLKHLALMSRRPRLENETIHDLGWSAAQTKCRNKEQVLTLWG